MNKSRLKKIGKWALLAGVALLTFIVVCNALVKHSAKDKIFSSLDEIPANAVALVLGTNPQGPDGFNNPYFQYRINAAAELYHAGKVQHIIVSGDNSRKSYNEPAAMQEALEKKGIPRSAITLDYAGFRTLDSVVRCREIFQQTQFTVISQQFHNERALFIAKENDLDVIAYNATNPFRKEINKTQIREYLARCKAVLDIYLLNKQPKYLGEKIDLPI